MFVPIVEIVKLTCRPQILAFVADSASNNNTLVDGLGDLLDGFQGSLTQVRCFAHILNLVVKVHITQIYPFHSLTSFCQSILSQFSQKTKVTEVMTEEAEEAATFHELEDELGEDETTEDVEEEDVGDEIDPAVAESDAAIINAVMAEASEEFDLPALTQAEVNLGKFTVTKVNIISLVRYRMTLTYVTSY